MCPANERWGYFVTSSLIGLARAQNDPCDYVVTTVHWIMAWDAPSCHTDKVKLSCAIKQWPLHTSAVSGFVVDMGGSSMMRRNHNSECRSRSTAYFVSIMGRRIRSQQWNCWINYKVVQMNTTWNFYRNISINCGELRLKYGVQAFQCFITKSCLEVLLRQVVCEKIFERVHITLTIVQC